MVGLIPGADIADLINAGIYLLEGDLKNAGLSSMAMLPFIGPFVTTGKHAVKAEKIIESLNGIYTKSSLKQGREIHKLYKTGDVYKDGYKEYRDIKGIRPDYVDFNKGIIYELKPGNPTGVRQGIRQLDRYKKAFENQDPNKIWETVLDLY